MAVAERRSLPDLRLSITHKTIIHDRAMGDVSLFLTVGMYPAEEVLNKIYEGEKSRTIIVTPNQKPEPGEVWINIGKVGTTLRGLTDTIAIELSLLLQYGAPVQDIVDQFRGQTYAPLGDTSNPDIPTCSSIIDYVVQWLAFRFLKEEEDGEEED